MISLKSLDDEYYNESIAAVTDWCSTAYSDNFMKYFTISEDLYNRLNSEDRPITDSELEKILIDVPLDLIQASECLTTFKTALETIKLALKRKRITRAQELRNPVNKDVSPCTESAAKKKSEEETIDDEILILAYQNLISKVESKISLTKELIMGAKKIFDRRKANEEVVPVRPVDERPEALPNYSIPGNTYVR